MPISPHFSPHFGPFQKKLSRPPGTLRGPKKIPQSIFLIGVSITGMSKLLWSIKKRSFLFKRLISLLSPQNFVEEDVNLARKQNSCCEVRYVAESTTSSTGQQMWNYYLRNRSHRANPSGVLYCDALCISIGGYPSPVMRCSTRGQCIPKEYKAHALGGTGPNKGNVGGHDAGEKLGVSRYCCRGGKS